jgi:predicted ATPase
MKIQLKNFGPIEFFEFDTKTQMHFIFGENNIGKSYAISAVYLILKNLKFQKNTRLDALLAMRPCRFANKFHAISFEEPDPLVVPC